MLCIETQSKSKRQNNLTPQHKRKLRSLSGASKQRKVSATRKAVHLTEEKKSVNTRHSTPRECEFGNAKHIFKEIKANYDFGRVRQQKMRVEEQAKADEKTRRENKENQTMFLTNILKNTQRSTSVSSQSSRRASVGLAKLSKTIKEAKDAQQNYQAAEEHLNETCRCRLREAMPLQRSSSLLSLPEFKDESAEYGQVSLYPAASSQPRGSSAQEYGAMMARGEAAEVFGPGDHASTYGGNPLACAAALAVAEYLSEHDILANVQARGEQLATGLADIATRYPSVLGEARGWGLLRGIPIKEDAGCTAAELVGDAMAEGLLLVAAGPSVVRFVPPLVVTEGEVAEALSRFEKAIAKRVDTSSQER